MAKRHLLILGLLLSGGALASACSDTKAVGIDSDAGAGGEAGETGHAGSANAGSGHAGSGHAGSANAGSGNEAGEAGANSEGGVGGEGGIGGEGGAEPPYEFPPSLNPHGVVVIGAAPSTATKVLVGGTDYKTATEIVSVTIGTGAVGDSTTYDDSDTLAISSAGIGFAVERTKDKVHQLDAGKISKTFDLKALGTNTAVTGTKAYVPLYNQSYIAVLDLTAGTVNRRIDLNLYNAAGDSDHSADIAEGVYDPNSKIAYFLLQRIDINAVFADPKGQVNCPATYGALIIGVDTRIDDVIDLNGEAPGKGIELKLANPNSLSINKDGDHLYTLGNGCFEGESKVKHGVEVVDLSDASTTVAYHAAGNDYLGRMIRTVGADALIQSSDENYATHWHKIDIAQGILGNEIANVPKEPSFDGTDLLGVEVTGKVGKVVRYKISTETSTEISPTSWGGQYSYVSSTALVP